MMRSIFKKISVFFLFLGMISCQQHKIYKDALIIKGGTIIDVSNNGTSTKDLTNKAIIIKGDTIFKIVDASEIIKNQPNVIDATGKFITPGLTDGFTVINNQNYANAFLYMGITDVIGVESERRGAFFHDSNPSPNIHMLREVGEEKITDTAIIDTITKHHKNGAEILLMMYKLTPNQVK